MKHYAKIAVVIAAAVLLCAAGTGSCLADTEEQTEIVTKAEAGTERRANIVIVSITGNEITYYEEEEESESEDSTQPETSENIAGEDGTEEAFGEEPDDMPEMGGMPEVNRGADASGSMPDMSRGGEMPSGMDGMGRDSRTTAEGEVSGQSESGGQMRGGRTDLMQSMTTVYLPVALVVHTDNDTDATFTILEAGDSVEALFVTDENGNEVITEIWMR